MNGQSDDEATRGLWWHDLVDWSKVGPGPAKWAWKNIVECPHHAPNNEKCALPRGHISYLKLDAHRTRSGREFHTIRRSQWARRTPLGLNYRITGRST